MKVKDDVDLAILLKYGFDLFDQEYRECYFEEEDAAYYHEDGYIYNLGHSRRGQFYYIYVGGNRYFRIYSTRPDGSEDSILLGNVLFDLISAGIVEKST